MFNTFFEAVVLISLYRRTNSPLLMHRKKTMILIKIPPKKSLLASQIGIEGIRKPVPSSGKNHFGENPDTNKF